jgi:hypothetical protein
MCYQDAVVNALVRILQNQIAIKVKLGIDTSSSYDESAISYLEDSIE